MENSILIKAGAEILSKPAENIWAPFDSRDAAYNFLLNYRSFISKHKLRPYQIEDILKFPTADFRVLYNHEMGLGKTPISMIAAQLFRKLNCVLLCKSSLQIQMFKEILEWTGQPSQIIKQPDDPLLPFRFFIVSLDLARKFTEKDWARFKAQTIIIDECQHIKNVAAKRTGALRKLSRQIPNVIATSANAIENHFKEYFPIMNILKPEIFRTEDLFINTWMHVYHDRYTGKVRGDRVRSPKLWRETTKNFIIHRSKKDVAPELPPVRKSNQYHNLEDQFADVYEAYVNEFSNYYEDTKDSGFALQTNLLGYFAKMRHLTGRAKIEAVTEFVIDFLVSTEDYELTNDGFTPGERSEPEKITLFYHHQDVAEMLVFNINEHLKASGQEPCLHFKGGMSAEERNEIVEEFKNNPRRRVLVASLLSAGEGLNLQFCHNSLLVERHWNHQKEEQAMVGRFQRLGSIAEHISASYFIALGTIDEYISTVVARKEMIVKEANEGIEVNFAELEVLKEIADMIVEKRGGKPWRSAF